MPIDDQNAAGPPSPSRSFRREGLSPAKRLMLVLAERACLLPQLRRRRAGSAKVGGVLERLTPEERLAIQGLTIARPIWNGRTRRPSVIRCGPPPGMNRVATESAMRTMWCAVRC